MPSKKPKTTEFSKLKASIEKKLGKGKKLAPHEQIISQRPELPKQKKKVVEYDDYLKVGIDGFDELFEKGVPKGTTVLVCGGPGSGKTIFCLQVMQNAALKGKNCLYMTFEESPERLRQHMKDFGWNGNLEKKGSVVIKKFSPFDISRQVEAMIEKAKGELMIDVTPMLFPKNFKPDFVFIDSLSAIASAFVGREESYRIYIEQLFALLEQSGSTSFLISESTDIATRLSTTGVEEFLADGVIVMYNIKRGNVRELALEVLKMRGAKFEKKIVAMQIVSKKGIEVYPEQEVFGEV